MGTSELSGKPDEVVRGNLAIDWHPIQEEVVIFLVASDKGKWDNLWLGGWGTWCKHRINQPYLTLLHGRETKNNASQNELLCYQDCSFLLHK